MYCIVSGYHGASKQKQATRSRLYKQHRQSQNRPVPVPVPKSSQVKLNKEGKRGKRNWQDQVAQEYSDDSRTFTFRSSFCALFTPDFFSYSFVRLFVRLFVRSLRPLLFHTLSSSSSPFSNPSPTNSRIIQVQTEPPAQWASESKYSSLPYYSLDLHQRH
jgi:hypothetical protein